MINSDLWEFANPDTPEGIRSAIETLWVSLEDEPVASWVWPRAQRWSASIARAIAVQNRRTFGGKES